MLTNLSSVYFICFALTVFLFSSHSVSAWGDPNHDDLEDRGNPWFSAHGIASRILFRNELFIQLTNCMVDQAAQDQNPCIRGVASRNKEYNNINDFYAGTETLIYQFCSMDCRQAYLDAMNSIASKCVTQTLQALSTDGNYTQATLPSTADALSKSMVHYFKARTCMSEDKTSLTPCTVDFLRYAKGVNLLDAPAEMFRDNLIFSLGGIKVMFMKANEASVTNVNSTNVCTACNLRLVQDVEGFYAKTLRPMLSKVTSEPVQNADRAHLAYVQTVQSVCGTNSMVSSLNSQNTPDYNPTSSSSTDVNRQGASLFSNGFLASSSVASRSIGFVTILSCIAFFFLSFF